MDGDNGEEETLELMPLASQPISGGINMERINIPGRQSQSSGEKDPPSNPASKMQNLFTLQTTYLDPNTTYILSRVAKFYIQLDPKYKMKKCLTV